MITETWGNGWDPLRDPYSHGKYKLDKNYKIKHNLPGEGTIEFPITVDHSKYAISDDEKLHYVCFADLNWVKTKSPRGGTALCF